VKLEAFDVMPQIRGGPKTYACTVIDKTFFLDDDKEKDYDEREKDYIKQTEPEAIKDLNQVKQNEQPNPITYQIQNFVHGKAIENFYLRHINFVEFSCKEKYKTYRYILRYSKLPDEEAIRKKEQEDKQMKNNLFLGGGAPTNKIKILGRMRNIIKQGRTLYCKYQGELRRLSELRKLERDLRRPPRV